MHPDTLPARRQTVRIIIFHATAAFKCKVIIPFSPNTSPITVLIISLLNKICNYLNSFFNNILFFDGFTEDAFVNHGNFYAIMTKQY